MTDFFFCSPLENKIVLYRSEQKVFLCFAQWPTSTSSQSSIFELSTKRLTSTLNNIIYYFHTCGKIMNRGSFMPSCEPPFVVFSSSGIIRCNMFAMIFGEFFDRLLNFPEICGKRLLNPNFSQLDKLTQCRRHFSSPV
jgi:hypothetical protein